ITDIVKFTTFIISLLITKKINNQQICKSIMKLNLAINGFGRIGRSFLRVCLKDKEFMNMINIVAINDLTDLKNIAHLLKFDSTFGRFDGEINIDENNNLLVINKELKIKIFSEKDPLNLPWKDLDIYFVMESSGKFTDANNAKKHIEAGAKKVIISAPAKGVDITILLGVNDSKYTDDKHNIISMASCTTNSLAPVIKVVNDKFGIQNGFMTTTHAYTNDQRLLDSFHKDPRRSRSALMSIIPTTTGAAKAIGEVIPELKGKIDGLALRVPVSNGSIADIVLTLNNEVTKEEINKVLQEASQSYLKGILSYTEEPIVSSDIIGDSHSSIVDGLSTMVLGNKGKNVKILSWYDNEWSFVCRLVDLIKFIYKNKFV
ncbi:MAG: type I glyceraldehyde-3-phosphate dehydrogenase, partial [Nitrososphaeraceae archaeon]|nr:type I glyceraldehyde-3-phosphate dehydrogenase [Nitrososphaeraceae archaeon]